MNAPTCLNLRESFPQHKITFDPAAEDTRDPWMMQIPGQHGTIHPHGGDLLAVEVGRRPATARQLANLGLVLHQDGDSEKTFLFPAHQFDAVAAIVHPRKKRKVSPATLERLKTAGHKGRKAQARKQAPQTAVE
jgi:hypothetical protein